MQWVVAAMMVAVASAGCAADQVEPPHLQVSGPTASMAVRSTGHATCSAVDGGCWTFAVDVVSKVDAPMQSDSSRWAVTDATYHVWGPDVIEPKAGASFNVEVQDEGSPPSGFVFDAAGHLLAIDFRHGDFPS